MDHPIYRVTAFERIGTYVLRLEFNDGTVRTVDFEPILDGELFGPLRDPEEFGRVRLDPEVHTVVWPSGADFDPATLHDWPDCEGAFREAAEQWRKSVALA